MPTEIFCRETFIVCVSGQRTGYPSSILISVKTMNIGNQKDTRKYRLKPDLPYMHTSEAEKDVGVIVDNKLKFEEHIAEKVNKANSILGAARGSFEYMDKQVFKKLYTAFSQTTYRIRPASMEPIQKERYSNDREHPETSNTDDSRALRSTIFKKTESFKPTNTEL